MDKCLGKAILDQGGFIFPIRISSKETKGTGLMNPSIYNDGTNLLINIRHINYTLFHSEGEKRFQHRYGPLVYINPENDLHLKTTNYIGYFNEEKEITRYYKVDTSKLDGTARWEFHGLEDARIVRWNDKLYLSGVRRDTRDDGEGRMELSEIKQIGNTIMEISRNRIQPPGAYTYCEKNWMPVVDIPYHYIKWTNPTQLVKADLTTNQSETVFLSENKIGDYPDMRGGSQVIRYKDYYFAIVHQVNLWKTRLGQKEGRYRHRFILWDDKWNIRYISEPFTFLNAEIEFACGMTIFNSDLYISFGFQDNAAYVVKIPKLKIDHFLFEQLKGDWHGTS